MEPDPRPKRPKPPAGSSGDLLRPGVALLVLLGAGSACTGSGDDGPGDPPPLGYPFIPAGYQVTITRVSDDCAVGGLTGTPQPTTLRWRQDIVSLSGTLRGNGQDTVMDLSARLCAQAPVDPAVAVDPASFAIHWTATARGQVVLDTDRRCRVDAVSPPGATDGEPPCGAGNRWFLSACGAFVGEASVALSFSDGCDVPRTCLLQLRYVGVPTVDHPDATTAQRLRCAPDDLLNLGLTAAELRAATEPLGASRPEVDADDDGAPEALDGHGEAH